MSTPYISSPAPQNDFYFRTRGGSKGAESGGPKPIRGRREPGAQLRDLGADVLVGGMPPRVLSIRAFPRGIPRGGGGSSLRQSKGFQPPSSQAPWLPAYGGVFSVLRKVIQPPPRRLVQQRHLRRRRGPGPCPPPTLGPGDPAVVRFAYTERYFSGFLSIRILAEFFL